MTDMTPHQQLLTVVSGELSYEITAALAARVAHMRFRGHDLLVGADVNPNNWGATYWTSPQADWGWPPVYEVDSAPYEAEVMEHNQGWRFIGPPAKIGSRMFRIEKCFSEGPHPGSIDTCYTIVNLGEHEFKMASWEIARVPASGLTFFPTGETALTPIFPHHPLHVTEQFGCRFFAHRAFELGKSLKLHADGQEGFLAHATNEHLILKLFKDTKTHQQAPGEGECEIFANLDGKYVEIEVQGPYVAIHPGSRHDFKVRTVVVPLGQELTLDDPLALANFARAQAAKFAQPDLLGVWEPDQ
jgi:hypothetical protein